MSGPASFRQLLGLGQEEAEIVQRGYVGLLKQHVLVREGCWIVKCGVEFEQQALCEVLFFFVHSCVQCCARSLTLCLCCLDFTLISGCFLHLDPRKSPQGKEAKRQHGGTICSWLRDSCYILQCQKKLIKTPWGRQWPQRKPTVCILHPSWRQLTSPWWMKSNWPRPLEGQSCPAIAASSRSA